jgi:two-component system sensor histidine kinase KdpD
MLARHFLAVIAVAVLTGMLVFVRDILNTPVVALLYLLAVLVSATQWGLGAGVVASVCSFLAFNYFFLAPYYTFAVRQSQDILVLGVFLVVAFVCSQLVGRVRSSLAEVQAREREVIRLNELSSALAGSRGEETIARLLAEHVYATFAAQAVRVSVVTDDPDDQLELCMPDDSPAFASLPAVTASLQSPGGPIGQIAIWCARPLDPKEERLLRTFTSQGELALERALLARTEIRAKILEESDRLKTALLSSVSHELRTPLVTIKAVVTSLRSKEVDLSSPAQEELLAALEEETDRLNQLVANLLNMSRLESGALKLQRQWNALAEVVDMTITDMANAVHDYHLEVDVSEDLPLVPIDAVLIGQVFANLISNGMKYAPPGSTIAISAEQQDEGTLLIQVTNQGPPVSPEHLDQIFEKFHRVTMAEQIPGVGLGLSICKGIVEAHGGRIWAENLPNGFAFKFTLPLTWSGAPPPRLPDTLE